MSVFSSELGVEIRGGLVLASASQCYPVLTCLATMSTLRQISVSLNWLMSAACLLRSASRRTLGAMFHTIPATRVTLCALRNLGEVSTGHQHLLALSSTG